MNPRFELFQISQPVIITITLVRLKFLFSQKSEKEMSDKKEGKNLDINVMAKMRDLGIFGHLNARMLSEFASAVQDSNLDSLKMYKDVNQSTDFQLAADFVIQYLKKHHLSYTLSTMKSETQNKISPPSDITEDILHFKSDDFIQEALDIYLQDAEQPNKIKEANHARFREELAERIANLKSQHSSGK